MGKHSHDAWAPFVAGDKAEWQLQQGEHVEQALQFHTASINTIGLAVANVNEDVKPGQVPDADFLVAAAEGILFEGLASLLHQVSNCGPSPECLL